jgi:hypothetical protein
LPIAEALVGEIKASLEESPDLSDVDDLSPEFDWFSPDVFVVLIGDGLYDGGKGA